jgi:hypothetical protein
MFFVHDNDCADANAGNVKLALLDATSLIVQPSNTKLFVAL